MSSHPKPTYKGRSLGVTVVTVAQFLIGAIHVFFGFLLLAFEISFIQATIAYDLYTVVFGLLVLIFAYYFWNGKKSGWTGTVAVSLFVTAVDVLALLDLPTIPGVPKFAGFAEVLYSVLLVAYLLQSHVRKKYLINASD